MGLPDISEQTVAAWRRHNEIHLLLLGALDDKGLAAKPAGSRGRDVARVFAHIYRVRLGWLHHHETGQRPKLARYDKGPPPAREQIVEWISDSGVAIEDWLERALRGDCAPRYFGKSPLRWMGYLISHESHHRGQIALALKQSGITLPESVSIRGLWGRWIFGK